jgi:electron transport complex protein RnfG
MSKTESTFKNMFLCLFLISAFASLALAGVYIITLEPITSAQKAKKERAIKEVIPEFDTLLIDTVKTAGSDIDLVVNMGYKDTVLVGAAVETFSTKGYNGLVQIMVGFLPDGTINRIEILQQKETPGLGTKMVTPEFRNQFYGKSPASFKLNVKKDGGEVDAITAATISSRAFCDAVQRAYNTYQNQGGSK